MFEGLTEGLSNIGAAAGEAVQQAQLVNEKKRQQK